jgi:hypothetical protein
VADRVPADLAEYFARCQERRKAKATKMWGLLKPRDQRLVREAAVMGFVQGERFGVTRKRGPFEGGFPSDAAIVEQVLIAVESFPDLYPTFRRLSRRADRA